MKRAALYTLGCRVNQYETEAMAESFIKNGYSIVDFEEEADVYVINTCTVTSIGDKKSRQMIRRSKKRNPNAVVVVAGCYSQVAPKEVAAIEGVDIIVGTSDKNTIPTLVEEFLKNHSQINHVDNIMNIRKFEELEIDEYQERTRAFLKIQDGCDRFCSYCMIPYARGPVRSREPENIVKEVEKLAANGFKEIILSGIHVASYGKDLGGVNLTDIIERINNIDGVERVRIGSVDPTFFSESVLERLKNVDKLCHHFHLSLQSGCTETLKRMNRHYTAEEYKTIVERLRDVFKDVSVTTDVIVGFPGETEEEFDTTYKFLKDIKLSKMHVFKYSPRKGTRAEKLPNQVDPHIKEERSKALIDMDHEFEKEFVEKFMGSTMKVLFEEKVGENIKGYTENYIRVSVEGDESICGSILPVKITGYAQGEAIGILN